MRRAAALGGADPVTGMGDTYGTGKVADTKMTDLVRAHFKLTPKGIIEDLNLRRPIYKKTAAFGHFGRTEPEFTWEKTDRAKKLAADLLGSSAKSNGQANGADAAAPPAKKAKSKAQARA